jgi:hypothetical protein
VRVLRHVRVDVHGDADLAVAQDLHHHAGSHPGRGERRRAAVPGVVQPDAPQAGSFSLGVADAMGVTAVLTLLAAVVVFFVWPR